MPRESRQARIDTLLTRALHDGEQVTHRGECWAVIRHGRIPLLLLGRHQYDVVLTDRRLLLFTRRRRRHLRADDVAFAKRFTALTLEASPRRVLLQHRIRTDRGALLVLEWRPRQRGVGRALESALAQHAARRDVPAT